MTLCLFKNPFENKCVKEGTITLFVVCDWASDDHRHVGL